MFGSLYLTDGSSASIFQANELAEASSALAFGSVNAGTTAPPQTATFTFDVGGMLAPKPYAVSTQGDLTLDFQPAATQAPTVCVSGKTYLAGDTCTVAATFTPRQPGARYGAIVLFAPSGAPIGTSYVQGVGVAAQVSFSPGQVLPNIGSLFSHSVTVDASGRYLYSPSSTGVVIDNYPGTQALLGVDAGFTTGYEGPTAFPVDASYFADGITVDGAGNIVYSSGYTSAVTSGATSFNAWDLNPTLPVTDPTKFAGVYGKAYLGATPITRTIHPPGNTRAGIDGAGNLFFTDGDGIQIVELHYVHGGYNSQTVVATGLNNPGDVVVDAAGAVYAADTGNNRIVKETPNGDGSYSQSIVDSGFTPSGLAVDRLGNVYTTQLSTIPGNPAAVLKEVLTSDGYTRTPLSLNADLGVDVDPAGDVFAVQLGQSSNLIGALDVSSPPSYIFAATAVGNTSADSPKTLTVTNNGNAPLNFTGVALSAGYNLATGSTCPAAGSVGALAAGASCTFLINFAPLQSGYTNGTLTLTDNHRGTSGATQVIKLSGQGTGTGTVVVTLTPAAHDYGSVNFGSSATQTFTLINGGSATAALTSASLSNPAFSVASTTCGKSLAAGGSCNYAVVFQPMAAGAQTATFSVVDAAGTQTASLTGTGAAAPAAALTPVTASFGTVPVGASSAGATFTLTNAGNATLSLSSFGVTGTGSTYFQLGNSTCGSSLAAGSSCTLSVTFKPAAAGTFVAQLTVTDAVGTQTATLSGTGSTAATAPQALLTPASADFGSVLQGTSAPASAFTLSNPGNAPLAIGTIALTGANGSSFAIASNTCGASLASGSSCAVQVTFTPTAPGASAASLTVTDSVGTQSATLGGTGLAAPSPADFTITASPAIQSAFHGETVTYTVSLTSADAANPFTSMVALQVMGLPSGSTANFSPALVVPGLGATSKLTVQIAPLTATNIKPARRMMQAGLTLCLLLPLFSPPTKRLRASLLLGIFCLLTAGLSGCGSGNGFAIPSSTYTLVVSGTSGTLTHTAQVSLLVK